jgi:hypothetical protein
MALGRAQIHVNYTGQANEGELDALPFAPEYTPRWFDELKRLKVPWLLEIRVNRGSSGEILGQIHFSTALYRTETIERLAERIEQAVLAP